MRTLWLFLGIELLSPSGLFLTTLLRGYVLLVRSISLYNFYNKYGEREVIMVGMREGFDTGMIPQVLCEDFGDFSRSRSPFLRACQTAGRQ